MQQPNFTTKELKPLKVSLNTFQQHVANFISAYYCQPLNNVYQNFPLHLIESAGVSDVIEPKGMTKNILLKPLSKAQQEALDHIRAKEISLIFGDTGSGKTEIYMHAMADALSEGKSVLMLMPEIALTKQIKERLEGAFKEGVIIWHSSMSKKALLINMRKILNGGARIVLGTRSALFLPLQNLGLIVIDEEHDSSYKSQVKSPYNARDVALYVAKQMGIKIVLGSATPLCTSYYNLQNSVFRLRGGFFKGRQRVLFDPSFEYISELMQRSIKHNLELGRQILVFIPTRANFKNLFCPLCKKAVECPHCAVPLSVHLKSSRLKCHYCNFTTIIPHTCPNCHEELRGKRMGTQEVAKEIGAIFSQARVKAFDRDEISSMNKLDAVLDDFRDKKIDVLVGTQMLSKGHDYHNIGLVIILGIDYLLHMNDYLALENAIALMRQISGRTGRREDGGIIIQSNVEPFLSQFMDDYLEFINFELSQRENKFPPFAHLALIEVGMINKAKAKAEIDAIASILRNEQRRMERGGGGSVAGGGKILAGGSKTTSMDAQKNNKWMEGLEIIGPYPAPIIRLRSKWRFKILLKSHSMKKLHQLVRSIDGRECIVDIDPINFS